LIDRFVADVDDYVERTRRVQRLALGAARSTTNHDVDVRVNMADDIESGDVYISVTGTSAEAGDDGEVGRGNRASGLITPYRPMTLEAAAGKNPYSHVGKLYNVLGQKIAERISAENGGVDVSCILASQIGHRIDDPRLIDVHVAVESELELQSLTTNVQHLAREELDALPALVESLLARRERLF
jgi:S-adenosylmethionine synthetase